MIEKQLTVTNALGLHARAAARLVSLAMTFESDVSLIRDEDAVDAKSMLGVMTMASVQHSKLTVRVDGPDEARAMEDIQSLFADKFGESE